MRTLAALLVAVCVCWAGAARAQTQVKPRFLVIFDTSGSMNHTPEMAVLGVDPFITPINFCLNTSNCSAGDVCVGNQCHIQDGVPTHGDGSSENPGCDENGDGLFNDSKIFQAKGALLNVISAFGQIDYGLETYFQVEGGNACTATGQCTGLSPAFTCAGNRCVFCETSGSPAGVCNPDWVTECRSTLACNNTNCGAGETAFCTGWNIPTSCNGATNPFGFPVTCASGNGSDGNVCTEYVGVGRDAAGNCVPNSGSVRVPFAGASDNFSQLVTWMNNSFSADGHELRGIGPTPLTGSLTTAKQYLENQLPGMPLTDGFVPCRSYAVILITDGQETCGGTPATAAQALRSTNIQRPTGGTVAIDVKTYVIGFALCPPGMPGCAAQQSLNAIAAAGGTVTAFSARSGADIELALAQIVQGSIKVEYCNNVDDNCDGVIDEGYDKGAPCTVGLGACQRSGIKVCGCNPGEVGCDPTLGQVGRGPTHTICNASPGPPMPEICNGIDDDCDGIVDDNIPGGCPVCTPVPETCNNRDDDCNGIVDDPNEIFPCPLSGPAPASCSCPGGRSCANLGDRPFCSCPPPCGLNVGECRPGTLACVAGNLVCQGGTNPTPEVCDGRDNNCDGTIDGLSRPCYPAGVAGCNVATGMCQGICLLGTQICPRLPSPAPSNSFGACMGAVTPQPEICNGLDDDCNGIVDDVPGGCGASCVPMPEICNCRDDNCNGIVDDNPMGEGDSCVTYDPAKVGVGPCRAGVKHCINCAFQCQGQIGPMPEICDGIDNDCDGMVDNGAMCPPSFLCIDGACQPACDQGEFPCAPDRICVDPRTRQPCPAGNRAGCYCLPNPCARTMCPPGQICQVTGTIGTCVDPCAGVSCPSGLTCVGGRCTDCYVTGCPNGKRCLDGICQDDPCAGVTCPFEDYCRDGRCVRGCLGVRCPDGQSCHDGSCQPDSCAGVRCPAGQVCNPVSGACIPNPCTMACMPGLVCNPSTGACEPDPCARVSCGACQSCTVTFQGAADCPVLPQCQPGAPQTFTQTGGGGCACSLAGRTAGPPLWLVLIGVVALACRRRTS